MTFGREFRFGKAYFIWKNNWFCLFNLKYDIELFSINNCFDSDKAFGKTQKIKAGNSEVHSLWFIYTHCVCPLIHWRI